MANVTFHVGTTTPGSSGLTAGGLYVDSSNGQIYYATSTTAKKQVGSSMKMMSDKGWVNLNGTTGTVIGSIASSTLDIIKNYASSLYVSIKSAPASVLYPNATNSSTGVSAYFTMDRYPNTTAGYPLFQAINPQVWREVGNSPDYAVCELRRVSLIFGTSAQVSHDYERMYSDGTRMYCNGNSRSDSLTSYLYIIAYKF